MIRSGDVEIDEASYTAKLDGRSLDLTFKEFELLKYIVQHPGRVFTRQQLLQEVWGYDYFGGTRTVDVHVRRLRAKLGPERESLIGTVRNVGYRFVLPNVDRKAAESAGDAEDEATEEPITGAGATLVYVTTVHRVLGEHELDDGLREAITSVIDEATTVDGIGPVDDQVRLDLQHRTAAVTQLVAIEGDRVLGYAHVDLRADTTASGHLVVAPSHRRTGIGRDLVSAMTDEAAGRRLAIWAHGNGEGARALATSLEWQPIRELRQLILHQTTVIPDPSYPDELNVRTFEPGRDEQAWVEVNSAAFASHPEQGRMTVSDLEQREEQPWFDPAGFFLAERDGVLLGIALDQDS